MFPINLVSLIDLAGIFFGLTALLLLILGWKKPFPSDAKWLVACLLICGLFYQGEKLLVSLNIPSALRDFEIYLQILFPSLWLFFFYAFLRESATIDLGRSEERYRTLIEQSSDGIFITDGSGAFIDVNPKACEMLGFDRQELLGQSLRSLVHQEKPDLPNQVMEEVSQGTRTLILERKLRRKDGTLVEVEIASKRMPDGRFQALARDLTERRQTEEALRQSEERFRSLFENSPLGILISRFGRVLYANPACREMFGYSPEAPIQGIALLDHVIPRWRQDIAEVIRKSTTGEADQQSLDAECRRLDGSTFPVQAEISNLTLHDGRASVALITNIARRKRAAEVLRALCAGTASDTGERFFSSLVRHLASAMEARFALVGELDEKENSIHTLAVWVGTTPSENFTFSLDGSPGQNQSGQEMTYIPQGARKRFPRDGLLAELEAESYLGAPLLSQEGKPLGLLAVLHDGKMEVTEDARAILAIFAARAAAELERKGAEAEVRRLNSELEERVILRTAQLEAANKELEAFSYSVSHDLRAPLRAMDGFSRIILEDFAPQLPEELTRYLNMISGNTRQMGRLIDDLLTFSRLSRQPLKKQEVDPRNLVDQVLKDLRPDAGQRHLEVNVEPLPICWADPVLLKQVLINLLSNAIKFTRGCDMAKIEVGSEVGSGRNSGQIVYFIKDNGVGFDMQYSDKIFGVFQRLHRAEDYEGTGVGLAIVERIVCRHGGRIWAQAEPEKGATFIFTLEGGDSDAR